MASMRPAADPRRDPTLMMLSFLTPPQMQKFASILVAEGDPETLDVLLAMVALGSLDRTVADQALSTAIQSMKGTSKNEKRLRETYERLHGESMDKMVTRSTELRAETQEMLHRRWGDSNSAKKLLSFRGIATTAALAWGTTEVVINALVNSSDPGGIVKNPMVLAGAGVAGAALWEIDRQTSTVPFAPNRVVAAITTDQPERDEDADKKRHTEQVRVAMNANPVIAKLYYDNLPAFLMEFKAKKAGESPAAGKEVAATLEMPEDLRGLITKAEFKDRMEKFQKDMDVLAETLFKDAGKMTVHDQEALMNQIRKDMGLEPYPPLPIANAYTG